MNKLDTKDAVEILLSEKKKADVKLEKAYDSYCLFPNEKDQTDWDTYSALSTALDMAISALQEKDSLIARLKAEAIKRNVKYMKSGDRYLIGFVDGMRLARSIVDGSIDEPKYVYPSEGTSDDKSRSDQAYTKFTDNV